VSEGGTPTIVLLPGLHGTQGLFGPLLNAIPPDYHRAAVGYPCDRVLNAEELVQYVDERTPREGPLVIVGESFSGPVATELAARRGRQMRLLVLAASFVSAPKAAWLCHLAAPIAGRGPRPLFVVRHALSVPAASAELLRQVRIEASSNSASVMASRLDLVAHCDARDALRRCSAPVLYLHARNDWVVKRRSLEVVQSIRPDTQVTEFNCGHMILQLRPQEAWAAVQAALAY